MNNPLDPESQKKLHGAIEQHMQAIMQYFKPGMHCSLVVYAQGNPNQGTLLLTGTPEDTIEAIKFMSQNAPRQESPNNG